MFLQRALLFISFLMRAGEEHSCSLVPADD